MNTLTMEKTMSKNKENTKENLTPMELPEMKGTSYDEFEEWIVKHREAEEYNHNLGRKRRGRKRKSKMYFTIETENAIVVYNHTDPEDTHIRNKIYNEHIKYAFDKLAENMIHTFKFYYFKDSTIDVQHAVITHLLERLPKFTKGKGKAFSYFSIVAKNYLIFNNNNNYKMSKKVQSLTDFNSNTPDDFDRSDAQQTKSEFLDLFCDYCYDRLENIFPNKRDQRIADAILILFKQRENIEEYNKKALYVMIREMTDAKTQQITKVVNQIQELYVPLYSKFEKTGMVQ